MNRVTCRSSIFCAPWFPSLHFKVVGDRSRFLVPRRVAAKKNVGDILTDSASHVWCGSSPVSDMSTW